MRCSPETTNNKETDFSVFKGAFLQVSFAFLSNSGILATMTNYRCLLEWWRVTAHGKVRPTELVSVIFFSFGERTSKQCAVGFEGSGCVATLPSHSSSLEDLHTFIFTATSIRLSGL